MPRVHGPAVHEVQGAAGDFEAAIVDGLSAAAKPVIAALRGTVTPDDIMPARTAWAAAVDPLLEHVADAYGQAAQETRRRIGRARAAAVTAAAAAPAEAPADVVPSIANPDVELYLAGARNRLVGLGDEVWEQCRATIIRGNRLGWGVRDIRDGLTTDVGLAAPRAGVIARTEINRAANAGSITQMRQLQVPETTKTWLAAIDNRTRPEHADADGQTVHIDAMFTVGGEEVDAPGDGSAENAINCRCTVAYDIPDDV